ncbi:MAG: YjbH domain-containing protein [Roseburia sp.]|nr:YjbH domain-containing protein [Roseburia sp.]MCM1420146.1 YjbH domain-containing protein [Bacteroides sp.]
MLGTSGLMNVPSAEMYASGTFKGGVSLVQKELLSDKFNYNTGIYYIDFTPFSFMEITFRETLLKTRKGDKTGFYQQDRSTTLRVRPLKEKEEKWWPSLVVGVNDIYSDHGASSYAAVYGVVTKNLSFGGFGKLGITAGFAKAFDKGDAYDGVLGGVCFTPAVAPNASVMAEYDTRGFNLGASLQLFKHLNLMCFTREFSGVCAGVSYQYTIRY